MQIRLDARKYKHSCTKPIGDDYKQHIWGEKIEEKDPWIINTI